MKEVCSLCGATPIYRDAWYVDEDGVRRVERVADHCSNVACEYHDPDQVDFDFIKFV